MGGVGSTPHSGLVVGCGAVRTCRLWTCADKPKGDYYSFTKYAHALNSSANVRKPLPSDSRCGARGVGARRGAGHTAKEPTRQQGRAREGAGARDATGSAQAQARGVGRHARLGALLLLLLLLRAAPAGGGQTARPWHAGR